MTSGAWLLAQRGRRVAAWAWAAPCTAVGLLAGGCALPFGARWRWHAGVLEVALTHPAAAQRPPRVGLPFAAITLGHVVIGESAAALHRLHHHERAHVAQYERWGALFLLAYPASSAWQWLHGRRAYLDNHFEIDARRREGPAGEATPAPLR